MGQTWNTIEIPDCLEVISKRSTRVLRLRLASESQRRTWELQIQAWRTDRTLNASLFVLPWDFQSKERIDLTAAQITAVRLIHKRAQVWSGGHSLDFYGFHHTEGTEALTAMLRAVEQGVI